LGVPIFASGRDAKQYLIERIVEEARREGVALSEIEIKMMYFSETTWTLPDMGEVNAAFEREYDLGEYEQKIAGLLRGLWAEAGDQDTTEAKAWEEAVGVLSKEDHYLLALMGVADGSIRPAGNGGGDGSWNRILKLVALGGGIFLVGVVVFVGYLVVRHLMDR